MESITVRLPSEYVKGMDELIINGEFINDDEAVRYAVNKLIDKKVPRILRRLYKEGKDNTK